MSALKRLWQMAAVYAVIALLLVCYVFANTDGSLGQDQMKPIPNKPLYYVGVLQESDVPEQEKMVKGIQDALAARGYTEGKNIKITVKSAGGDSNKLKEFARKMASDQEDLVIAVGTESAKAMASVTKTLPVVGVNVVHFKTDQTFTSHSNMTGITATSEALAQLRIAEKLFPIHTMGILYNPNNDLAKEQLGYIRRIAGNKGLRLYEVAFTNEEEMLSQLSKFKGTADIVYVPEDETAADHFEEIAHELTDVDHIPLIGEDEEMVRKGALLLVTPEYYRLGFSGGRMAADLLAGDKVPDDLSIARQTDPDIFINMAVCKKLGIKLPSDVWQTSRKLYLYQGAPARP